MASFGYAWVPEGLPGMNKQIEAFHRFGLDDEHIFEDRQTGIAQKRVELEKLISKCKKNDLILIKNLDRLGTSYEMIRKYWIAITAERLIHICIIDSPMIDTRRDRELVNGIVISFLDYAIQSSNTGSKEIQVERVRAAKSRGVKFGRPNWEATDEFKSIYQKYKNGELNASEAARRLSIPRSTFRYRLKAYEKAMK